MAARVFILDFLYSPDRFNKLPNHPFPVFRGFVIRQAVFFTLFPHQAALFHQIHAALSDLGIGFIIGIILRCVIFFLNRIPFFRRDIGCDKIKDIAVGRVNVLDIVLR